MSRNLLIVDDSRMARMFIRRCLEMLVMDDVAFIEAENGKDALAKLGENEISIVIADLNMPIMDGKALLRWMKAKEAFKSIPVVFITSANNFAKIRELMELGAKTVLSKPVSPASLAPVMEKLLK
ncbi:response regulator [Deltaproteobacteria bacterium TL4]